MPGSARAGTAGNSTPLFPELGNLCRARGTGENRSAPSLDWEWLLDSQSLSSPAVSAGAARVRSPAGSAAAGGINGKSDFPREHFAGQDVAVSRHINLPQSVRGFGGIFLHGNRPKIRASNAIPLFVATTPLGDSGCGKKMMKIC